MQSGITIRSVLTETGCQSRRIRRLPAAAVVVVVWLVIAIGIWSHLDIPAIRRQVVGTLRSLFLSLNAGREKTREKAGASRKSGTGPISWDLTCPE